MTREWRIGEFARAYRLNPRTLRYYEAIGLFPTPRRTPVGYWLYGVSHHKHVKFIVKARAIGLTLAEIRDIISLRDHGEEPCTHVTSILNGKLAAVDRQLTALAAYRQKLDTLLNEARATHHTEACLCGIIERHEVTIAAYG